MKMQPVTETRKRLITTPDDDRFQAANSEKKTGHMDSLTLEESYIPPRATDSLMSLDSNEFSDEFSDESAAEPADESAAESVAGRHPELFEEYALEEYAVEEYDLGSYHKSRTSVVHGAVRKFLDSHKGKIDQEALEQLRELVRSAGQKLPRQKSRRKKPIGEVSPENGLAAEKPSRAKLVEPAKNSIEEKKVIQRYWQLPLDRVRAIATGATVDTELGHIYPNRYLRSAAVRAAAGRRAKGICEGCGQPAPFTTADGRPYLEAHHTIPLAEGGPDEIAWVIAICPACHRHAHYANDATSFNERLKQIVNHLEAANPEPKR